MLSRPLLLFNVMKVLKFVSLSMMCIRIFFLSIMKGNLLLQLKRPDAAVTAFRTAQELRPDLRSYQGISWGDR